MARVISPHQMKTFVLLAASLALSVSLSGCKNPHPAPTAQAPQASKHRLGLKDYPTFGSIQRLDPRLDALIPPDAQLEKLADGFDWSEGPIWIKGGRYLLFSDVPRNIIYSWSEGMPVTPFMTNSGYNGKVARAGEPGSNGLTTDAQGRLVLCEHGNRRVSRLETNGKKTTVAEYYKFYRFNSPNDLAFHSRGDLYFTDPPYGLVDRQKDAELNFCGVYRASPKGDVTLLTDALTFPNGIAFSPDEKTLLVAISDPNRPVIVAFDVKADGTLGEERVFFDASSLARSGLKGLPDGLKVDRMGNVFATGPGGVLILSPDGTHLGTILTGEATANCNWGNDGSVLYITADMYLCRVRTTTKGKGW